LTTSILIIQSKQLIVKTSHRFAKDYPGKTNNKIQLYYFKKMSTVTDNFKNIHEWLEKNADKILNESLNPDADKDVIENLESVIH